MLNLRTHPAAGSGTNYYIRTLFLYQLEDLLKALLLMGRPSLLIPGMDMDDGSSQPVSLVCILNDLFGGDGNMYSLVLCGDHPCRSQLYNKLLRNWHP